MKIKVTNYKTKNDGSAELEIEYDNEFAEHAIRQFVLWSLEKQVEDELEVEAVKQALDAVE